MALEFYSIAPDPSFVEEVSYVLERVSFNKQQICLKTRGYPPSVCPSEAISKSGLWRLSKLLSAITLPLLPVDTIRCAD
jgi:hypothetical protein